MGARHQQAAAERRLHVGRGRDGLSGSDRVRVGVGRRGIRGRAPDRPRSGDAAGGALRRDHDVRCGVHPSGGRSVQRDREGTALPRGGGAAAAHRRGTVLDRRDPPTPRRARRAALAMPERTISRGTVEASTRTERLSLGAIVFVVLALIALASMPALLLQRVSRTNQELTETTLRAYDAVNAFTVAMEQRIVATRR